MHETTLETGRLRLRARVMADVEANLAMDMDPEVHRYIFGDHPPHPDGHRNEIRRRIATGWPERGGVWVVEWKTAPGFLGWCGIFPLEESGLMEIGYRYVRTAWGHGIATEAARRVLDHGIRVLGIDPVVAVAHPDNLASQNVIMKIGLKPEGTAFHYGQHLAFFRLGAADYDAGLDLMT